MRLIDSLIFHRRHHLGPAFAAAALIAMGACADIGDSPAEVGSAAALIPPADGAFAAFQCGDANAADDPGDITGDKELDIVGDDTHPAIYRAIDATYLYLRMRLDDDPSTSAANLGSGGWAFFLDTDDTLTSFEYGVYVEGAGGDLVTWERNDSQSPSNDPDDDTRTQLQILSPDSDYWAVTTASGSAFGGDTDYFLTVALPLSALATASIDTGDNIAVWAVTGSDVTTMNIDIACDGGSFELSSTATDEDPLDSVCALDTDGDGQCDDVDPCPLDNPDDTDLDGQCDSDDPCPLHNPDDPDMDGLCGVASGECGDMDPDTDFDGICDANDNCPTVANEEQTDNDNDDIGNACDQCIDDADNDIDEDSVCGNVDNCPDVPNLGQEDQDDDGIGDVCETCPDPDGDFVCSNVDNCRLVANEDQADLDGDGFGDACDDDANGDGVDDGFEFSGGGCSTGPGGGGGFILFLLVLLTATLLRSRRRLAAAVVVTGSIGLLSSPAVAQNRLEQTFPIERFRLTTTNNGLLNVESGRVPGHFEWGVSAWIGGSDDTLVLTDRRDPDMERAASIVDTRVAGAVGVSLSLFERIAVGAMMPLVFYQDGDTIDGLNMASALSSGGVGDLQLEIKGALLPTSAPLEFAARGVFSVPTASSDSDFFGEDGVSFSPEFVLSKSLGKFRAAANLGVLFRKGQNTGNLRVDDELYLRFGIGYRPLRNLEVVATAVHSTSLKDPYTRDNRGVLETLAGATYAIDEHVSLFAGGGSGLDDGFGAPDWRLLGGARIRSQAKARPTTYPRDDEPSEETLAQADIDGDGILDTMDRCPEEPETVNGVDDDDGCPDAADTDGDGLVGDADSCPSEAEDLDGFQDSDGCPDLDNDEDGVVDGQDRCVETRGPVENHGCPDLDRDADGVVDRLDNCPDESGPEKNRGCKKKQLVTITPTKLEIVGSVLFASGRARIRPVSNRLLRNVAAVLTAHPEIERVEIGGHTDDRGNAERNGELSQKRAEAVRNSLVKLGVEIHRLVAVGYGPSQPIADNGTAVGRAANRRVEFQIRPTPSPEQSLAPIGEPSSSPDSTAKATTTSSAAPVLKAGGGALSTRLRGHKNAKLAAPSGPVPTVKERASGPAKGDGPTLSRRTMRSPRSPAAASTENVEAADAQSPEGAEIDPNDVAEMYHRHRTAVQRCYVRALKANPLIETKRTDVLITVHLDGSTTATAADIENAGLQTCIERTISTWKFPTPKNSMRTQLTVVFRAR